MNKGFFKKGLHIFMCGLLVAAVLIAAGCSDNKTKAAPVKDKAVVVEQQVSSARNTPIVAAAKKVGPAVVGITNKAYVRDFFNRVKFVERGTGSLLKLLRNGFSRTP